MKEFELIRQWAEEKGITHNSNAIAQFGKLTEEVNELIEALENDNQDEVIDAIGDCSVVLTNIATLRGVKIEDCIQQAYNVISKRNGKMVNGVFVKE